MEASFDLNEVCSANTDAEYLKSACNYFGCSNHIVFNVKKPTSREFIKSDPITITNYTCEDENIIIPYGVKKIESSVFAGTFESITFPSSIEKLETEIFYPSGSISVEYLLFPNSIKNIYSNVFLHMYPKNIYLGNQITNISIVKENWEAGAIGDLQNVYTTSKNTQVMIGHACDEYGPIFDYEICMDEPNIILR